jgi:hypothetical protein
VIEMSQGERTAKGSDIISDQDSGGAHLIAQCQRKLGIPGRDQVPYAGHSGGIGERRANPTGDWCLADDQEGTTRVVFSWHTSGH